MCDPAINEGIINYLKRNTEKIQNEGYKNCINQYLNSLFNKRTFFKWAEFEYCAVLPFKLIKEEIPISIKFPKIGENSKVNNYVKTLNELSQKAFEKKVLLLPLSCPTYLLKEITEDDNKTKEWESIIESITVNKLPTDNCFEMIDQLHQLKLYEEKSIPKGITLTQTIIDDRVDSKNAIWELFKQNSKSLIGMFEASKKDGLKDEMVMAGINSDGLFQGKRERKITFIKMDYETIAKDNKANEKLSPPQKPNPKGLTKSSTEEQKEERWKMSSFMPTTMAEENSPRNGCVNPFEIMPLPFYQPPSENRFDSPQEVRFCNCPLLKDYDFERFYRAQTNFTIPEQLTRLHRINSLVQYEKTRHPEEIKMEEVIDTTSSSQNLDIRSIFH